MRAAGHQKPATKRRRSSARRAAKRSRLKVHFPILPTFPSLGEEESQALLALYERRESELARGVAMVEQYTGEIEKRAQRLLEAQGYGNSTSDARKLHRHYVGILHVARPIYSWVPRSLALGWARNHRRQNLVARLYYFLLAFEYGTRPEWPSLIKAAAFANGYCRAAFSELCWRLGREVSPRRRRGAGLAVLRLLAGNDEEVSRLLRAYELVPEAFATEFMIDPRRTLSAMIESWARREYGKRWPAHECGEEQEEAALLALVQAVRGEAGKPRRGTLADLLFAALTEWPGRVVAGGGGRYANRVREAVRDTMRAPKAITFDVPEHEAEHAVDLLPDRGASTEEAAIVREFNRALTPRQRRLLELRVVNPRSSPSELAKSAGASSATAYRDLAEIRRKSRIFL